MKLGTSPTTGAIIIRIDRKEICFVKNILEAYDGVALMTTLDADRGIVRLSVAPGRGRELKAILDDLKRHILIEAISAGDVFF